MPIIFVLFAGFIIFILVAGARQAAAKRAALEDRISNLESQLYWLESNMAQVDERSADRVRQTGASVREKVAQARMVSQRGRDRDYARAYGILDQIQEKIIHRRGDLERALGRVQAATQRRMEAEQRRQSSEQRRALSAAGKAGRSGSFGATGAMTSAATDWNAIPRSERGACFFCGRPALLRELTPTTLALEGMPRRVLACFSCMEQVRLGVTPPVRAFVVEHHYVPWYAYPSYNPYVDYYAQGYDEAMLPTDLTDADQIAPEYWQWQDKGANGWTQDAVFAPDNEGYQDFYSSAAAASADYDLAPTTGGLDFSSNVGGVDFAPISATNDFGNATADAPTAARDIPDTGGAEFAPVEETISSEFVGEDDSEFSDSGGDYDSDAADQS